MKRILAVVSYLGSFTILCMALLTGVDVTTRYVFNNPVDGGVEIIELMMVIVIACGVAMTTAADDHISVDSLYDKLPPLGQRLCRLSAGLITTLVFAVLAWQGIHGWLDAIEAKKATHVLEISTSPFQLFLALGFFISFIFSLIQTLPLLQMRKR